MIERPKRPKALGIHSHVQTVLAAVTDEPRSIVDVADATGLSRRCVSMHLAALVSREAVHEALRRSARRGGSGRQCRVYTRRRHAS